MEGGASERVGADLTALEKVPVPQNIGPIKTCTITRRRRSTHNCPY